MKNLRPTSHAYKMTATDLYKMYHKSGIVPTRDNLDYKYCIINIRAKMAALCTTQTEGLNMCKRRHKKKENTQVYFRHYK